MPARIATSSVTVDFAECMRDLVDEHYPDADRIKLVLDNLSTHSPGARYLSQRHRERGTGWKRYPNSKLYAMGLIYIGSGRVRYATNAAR